MTESGEKASRDDEGIEPSGRPGARAGWRPTVSFRQFVTFLAVGVWNTLFGFASYALITFLLEGLFPFHYVVASLLASVLNVTASFLAYKWIVFKTRGRYIAEWLRAIVVYSGVILAGATLLPVLVWALAPILPRPDLAPYCAGAVLSVGQAAVSFVAHRRFTFHRARVG